MISIEIAAQNKDRCNAYVAQALLPVLSVLREDACTGMTAGGTRDGCIRNRDAVMMELL